jgi:hypothetical protein
MKSLYRNEDKYLTKPNLTEQSTLSPKEKQNDALNWQKWLFKNLAITLAMLVIFATYSYSTSDKPLLVKSTQFAQPIYCSNQANRTSYAIQCAAIAN